MCAPLRTHARTHALTHAHTRAHADARARARTQVLREVEPLDLLALSGHGMAGTGPPDVAGAGPHRRQDAPSVLKVSSRSAMGLTGSTSAAGSPAADFVGAGESEAGHKGRGEAGPGADVGSAVLRSSGEGCVTDLTVLGHSPNAGGASADDMKGGTTSAPELVEGCAIALTAHVPAPCLRLVDPIPPRKLADVRIDMDATQSASSDTTAMAAGALAGACDRAVRD